MSEKTSISSSFYKQLTTIGAIVVTTLGGVKYGLNEVKSVIHDEMRPLAERVDRLENSYENVNTVLAVNTPNIEAVTISVNSFLEYYNRVYHKEFLRPSDISITSEKKRK